MSLLSKGLRTSPAWASNGSSPGPLDGREPPLREGSRPGPGRGPSNESGPLRLPLRPLRCGRRGVCPQGRSRDGRLTGGLPLMNRTTEPHNLASSAGMNGVRAESRIHLLDFDEWCRTQRASATVTLSFFYRAFCRVLQVIPLLGRSDTDLAIEAVMLRAGRSSGRTGRCAPGLHDSSPVSDSGASSSSRSAASLAQDLVSKRWTYPHWSVWSTGEGVCFGLGTRVGGLMVRLQPARREHLSSARFGLTHARGRLRHGPVSCGSSRSLARLIPRQLAATLHRPRAPGSRT